MTTVLYEDVTDPVAESFDQAYAAVTFAEAIRRLIHTDVHIWHADGVTTTLSAR